MFMANSLMHCIDIKLKDQSQTPSVLLRQQAWYTNCNTID